MRKNDSFKKFQKIMAQTPNEIRNPQITQYSTNDDENIETQESIFIEFQYILCVNCDKNIFFEEVQKHSEVCNKVNIINENKISNIQFKQSKLLEFLKTVHIHKQDKCWFDEITDFFAENLKFSSVSHSTLSHTKKFLFFLEDKISKTEGTRLFLKSLIERTLNLVNEKIRALKILLGSKKTEILSLDLSSKNLRKRCESELSFNSQSNSSIDKNSFNLSGTFSKNLSTRDHDSQTAIFSRELARVAIPNENERFFKILNTKKEFNLRKSTQRKKIATYLLKKEYKIEFPEIENNIEGKKTIKRRESKGLVMGLDMSVINEENI